MSDKLRIIYVDDYKLDRELVRDALRSEGDSFSLLEASSKAEFEKLWARGRCDLVLTDFNISGWEGLQVLSLVHKTDPSIPVIIVTGTGSEEIAVEAMKLGAADYVIKTPRHIRKLPQAIRAAIDKNRAEQEKMEALSELRSSEEMHRRMIEGLHEGIWVIDADARTTYANPAMAAMLGYERSEMTGMHLFSFMDESEIEKCSENLNRRKEGIPEQHEFRFRKKDGGSLFVLLDTNPMLGDNGEYLGAIAGVIDITERKELQADLLQARKMEAVGLLAGGIAHDFNNLLTVINGNVELLLMDIGKGDPLRNEINEIRSASLSAAKLTKQLLAFSRKQPVHMKVLDFATLLDGSRSMLERVLREDIIISLEVKVSGGYVLADSSFLEQIILNMAINSRDAMPEGGTLTFLLDRIVADEQFVSGGVLISPGEYIRLRISDTGTGMTDDCREKIFEPFFTTKTKEKGSGLGLSSVYGMVKQMKGFVTVDSKVGEGAVFSVFLPAVDGMPEKKDAPGRHRRDKVENATLLVVEDDPAVLQFLQRILTRQGYKVLTAIDADSAFERSRSYEKAIDIVITDIVLPGMNGIDLVKKLKKTRQTVRELFISGYFQEEEEGDTLLVPGVNLLQKPFESADLIRIIDQLLSYRDSP